MRRVATCQEQLLEELHRSLYWIIIDQQWWELGSGLWCVCQKWQT